MRHLPYGKRLITALGVGILCATALSGPAAADAPQQEPAPVPDGLALTPPMGFNNWNSTECGKEFNAEMIKDIADIFVAKGLKDAGYEYVNLDDCWALPERDDDGKLVPDPERFPDGLKELGDYIHSKGLKFGIYSSAGTHTCSDDGFPGALGHEESDAQQFADWGVDYLKYDNCNNEGQDALPRFTAMRDALAATGRPIVYAICEWGSNDPWEWAGDLGHLWRSTGDINDTWPKLLENMKENLPLAEYAGPGQWNDPDMLEVGNGGMTDTEYRSHFSMWSVMAAPLLIGTDLREADDAAFEILSNEEVIAVDQDPLGKQGAVVSSEDGRWVVSKEMADGSRAVALFNETSEPQRISTSAEEVGLSEADGYRVRDLWQHRDSSTAGGISASVPPHGTVLYRVTADEDWSSHPPAADFGLDSAPYIEPGGSAEVSTTFRNSGATTAEDVSVDVQAPSGWEVEATSASTAAELEPGASLTTEWQVSAPADADTGAHELSLTADYASPDGAEGSFRAKDTAFVAAQPPEGTSYASDWDWLTATNGWWGPVERDTSVGDMPEGDGKPLTIGGETFEKGLGAHAPSEIIFYTGEQCTEFTAKVGVDDEEGDKGSVDFEVWADDTKVAETDVLKGDMGAEALSADVGDATQVKLVVNDGGDWMDNDHADWADARFSC